uniref:Uncharacterized protein n=1 Tax=viral metagenome TaxID=1070528 RepID=A0A6H2A4T2_9ZZZZ
MAEINPKRIMAGMAEKNRMLTQKNEEYVDLVEKRAQAERAYNIAVARETLNQKAEGQSITIIDKLVRGDRVIADLKYALDVAEGVQRACLQSIKAITIQIDSYRSLLAWAKAEMLRSE